MEMIENKILLSFIVPVYNVEKYVDECIVSVLPQMTDECELILVDDGSTDSSGAICNQYSERNSKIRVIHKENGGLSSARNIGINFAKGEYVSFIDSDDKISDNSVGEILTWIKSGGTDICFLQTEKFFPSGLVEDLGEYIKKDCLLSQKKEKAIEHLASRPKYPGSAWAKLYRREFLINNNLHFPYDRRFSEDLGFVRDCIYCAKSFDSLEIPYYKYRQNRQGSITNKRTDKSFLDLSKFVSESIEKFTINKKAKDLVSQYMMSFVAYEYLILLYQYNSVSKVNKKEALTILKEFRWILKFSLSLRNKIIACLCRILGIRFSAFLMKEYRKALVT